jgi:putative tryptophan/tyrosine transport system substrate-binding protein
MVIPGAVTLAQPWRQLPRIGVLFQGGRGVPDLGERHDGGEELSAVSEDRDRYAAFLSGLRELGHVQGRNIIVETRAAKGKLEVLPILAAELVSLKVSTIVVSGWTAIEPAIKATKTIPIIMINAGDALRRGFIESLPISGGNVTGLVGGLEHGKRFEILKDAIPSVSRVAVLNPVADDNELELIRGMQRVERFKRAAKARHIEVESVNVSRFEHFQAALAKIAAMHPDALIVHRQFLTISRRKQIADFALRAKLPSIFEGRDFVQAGGFLSYGPNDRAAWRRAAAFADKILKGANPANLPVETPPLELVINLATAKKLGITIAPELLLEADEVIR